MKKLIIAVALLLMSPVAFGQILDMTLDSSNDPDIHFETGYVVDDILGIEVAERANSPRDWVWPVMEFTFGPVDLTLALELQLNARVGRPLGYGDSNIWLVLFDSDGTEWDLGWNPLHWTQDEWILSTRDLTTLPGGDFDGTQAAKVAVRSTNWGALDPNDDFYRFSNLTITAIPEPGTMALFGLGLLSLLTLRRKK